MMNTGRLTVAQPSDTEVVLTRVFDAPRALVFRALTEPALLRRWFGPRGYELVVCEVDLRVGGRYFFVVRAPDGSEMGIRGVHTEIVVPERIRYTESSECDAVWGEDVEVIRTLSEQAGCTTMTTTLAFGSREVRDSLVGSGMEYCVAEGFDRLAEILTGVTA